MNIRFKTLNPGSMLIYKKHNIFKQFWYKLLKKELPYNSVVIFVASIDLMDCFSGNSEVLLATPKRKLNHKETRLLSKAIKEIAQDKEDYWYGEEFKGNNIYKLITALSNIRPTSNASIEGIINHPDYNVRKIATETDWNICIY